MVTYVIILLRHHPKNRYTKQEEIDTIGGHDDGPSRPTDVLRTR